VADSLYIVIQKEVMNIVVIVMMCMAKHTSGCTNTEVCEVAGSAGVTKILKS